MEEFDILNENGLKINEIRTYNETHDLGLWHNSIEVVVVNNKNEILVQQRQSNKDFYPDLWDYSICGHVKSGEMPIEATIREIKEEVGLNVSEKDLKFLFSFRQQVIGRSKIESLFVDVFIVKKRFDESEIMLQESEVQAYKLLKLEEIKEMMDNDLVVCGPEAGQLLGILEKELNANKR